MKNLRKTVSVLLTAVMLFSVVSLGSIYGIKTQAATSPVFELKKTQQTGNIITVEVNIVSGSFNALDFNFVTTGGVSCESITPGSNLIGVGNKNNASISEISTSAISSGTVLTATFSVPSSASYSISGNVSNCLVTSSGSSGEITNTTVSASVRGTVTGGGQVQPVITPPSFVISKVSQNGNKVNVQVNLTSGSFSTMDFYFSVSSGVVCDSITVNSAYRNNYIELSRMYVSIVALNSTGTGNVINATFTVPSNSTYSISGYLTNCAVTTYGSDGQAVTRIVTASVSGSAYGTGPSDPVVPPVTPTDPDDPVVPPVTPVIKTGHIDLIYKENYKITLDPAPAGSIIEFDAQSPSIAKVDSNGNVTATGRGTGIITCKVTTPDRQVTTYQYTVTVSYTLVQWIIMILLFGWLWY